MSTEAEQWKDRAAKNREAFAVQVTRAQRAETEVAALRLARADQEEFIAGVRAALSHTEAERDEARAEADSLRVTLGKVAAKVAEVDGWKPYESRDTGSVYLSDSVDDLVTDIRAILAADPVALADVRRCVSRVAHLHPEDCVYFTPDSETVTDHG